MIIENIEIARIIAHEVKQAGKLAEGPPVISQSLIEMDAGGSQLIAKRLVNTIASGSHCIDVVAEDASANTPFDLSSRMLEVSDAEFIACTGLLALQLTLAQTSGSIKSGSAIFLHGTCVADGQNSRFSSIIKADSDQGFFKQTDGNSITLTFVRDMLLGDSQRLLKLAFFVEAFDSRLGGSTAVRSADDFVIKVFDQQMHSINSGDAANYFFRTFLKCRLADSAPRDTRKFFEFARSYINTGPFETPERVMLQNSLVSYLRSNETIVNPRDFALSSLPVESQESFIAESTANGIKETISKDTSLIKHALRKQSLKFSSGVNLFGTPEALANSVKVGNFENGWTTVEIRGAIELIK